MKDCMDAFQILTERQENLPGGLLALKGTALEIEKEKRNISSEVKQACSLANVLRLLVAPSFLIWRSEVISVITNMNISCPQMSIGTLEAVCCMQVQLAMPA